MTAPLSAFFHVRYGNKLDLNKLVLLDKRNGGINFVGRSSRNHGVSATVSRLSGLVPYPAGCITVALGGTKLLASFVQLEPFYTAQNVAVLQERFDLSMAEKLFLCICIRHNRDRYSAFGREANRTIRTLPVPERSEFPKWLAGANLEEIERSYRTPQHHKTPARLDADSWGRFTLAELFNIHKGRRLTKSEMKDGDTPFISAIDSNNGLRQRINGKPNHPGGVITVNYNGNGVAEAFYQPDPFSASDDVNVLYPKFNMDKHVALFICTIIRREKYRFSYGRKWTRDRMKASMVRLPVSSDGSPDFVLMREIVASLPYSANLS
jgi:hypothetical protein